MGHGLPTLDRAAGIALDTLATASSCALLAKVKGSVLIDAAQIFTVSFAE